MTTDTRAGSDFARLPRRVADAGLLDRAPAHYAARFLLVAAVAAVLYGQITLLAHDVAHRQVFATRRAAELAGRLLGNLGIGPIRVTVYG